MSKSASVVLAVMLGAFGPGSPAHAFSSSPHVAEAAPKPTAKPAPNIKVGMSPISYAETREPITSCANFAAIRALMAKASGSDFAIQNRVLNVTFLLCMRDAGQAD